MEQFVEVLLSDGKSDINTESSHQVEAEINQDNEADDVVILEPLHSSDFVETSLTCNLDDTSDILKTSSNDNCNNNSNKENSRKNQIDVANDFVTITPVRVVIQGVADYENGTDCNLSDEDSDDEPDETQLSLNRIHQISITPLNGGSEKGTPLSSKNKATLKSKQFNRKEILSKMKPFHTLKKVKVTKKKGGRVPKDPVKAKLKALGKDILTIERVTTGVQKTKKGKRNLQKEVEENFSFLDPAVKRLKYTKLVGAKRGPKKKNPLAKDFPCKLCTYSSTSNWNLLRHINVVHKLKKDKFSKNLEKADANEIFEDGEDEFAEEMIDISSLPPKIDHEEAINGHKRGPKSQVDPSKKGFSCLYCTYSTARSFDLKRHISTIHKKEKKFKCKLCEFSTGYELSLKSHMAKMHDENKYRCEDCNFRTAKRLEYNRHLKDIHGIGTYKCDICWEFTGFSPVQVTHHKRRQHLYSLLDLSSDSDSSSYGSEPEFGYPDGIIDGSSYLKYYQPDYFE